MHTKNIEVKSILKKYHAEIKSEKMMENDYEQISEALLLCRELYDFLPEMDRQIFQRSCEIFYQIVFKHQIQITADDEKLFRHFLIKNHPSPSFLIESGNQNKIEMLLSILAISYSFYNFYSAVTNLPYTGTMGTAQINDLFFETIGKILSGMSSIPFAISLPKLRQIIRQNGPEIVQMAVNELNSEDQKRHQFQIEEEKPLLTSSSSSFSSLKSSSLSRSSRKRSRPQLPSSLSSPSSPSSILPDFFDDDFHNNDDDESSNNFDFVQPSPVSVFPSASLSSSSASAATSISDFWDNKKLPIKKDNIFFGLNMKTKDFRDSAKRSLVNAIIRTPETTTIQTNFELIRKGLLNGHLDISTNKQFTIQILKNFVERFRESHEFSRRHEYLREIANLAERNAKPMDKESDDEEAPQPAPKRRRRL